MPLLAHARAEVDPRLQRYLALVDRMFWGPQGTFAAGNAEPAQLIEQMLRHHEQVKAAVPPERLLVWEVGEGWEPLCEFLDVPVPDGPLPHANDRGTFVERVIGGALDTLQAWRERRAPELPGRRPLSRRALRRSRASARPRARAPARRPCACPCAGWPARGLASSSATIPSSSSP